MDEPDKFAVVIKIVGDGQIIKIRRSISDGVHISVEHLRFLEVNIDQSEMDKLPLVIDQLRGISHPCHQDLFVQSDKGNIKVKNEVFRDVRAIMAFISEDMRLVIAHNLWCTPLFTHECTYEEMVERAYGSFLI